MEGGNEYDSDKINVSLLLLTLLLFWSIEKKKQSKSQIAPAKPTQLLSSEICYFILIGFIH